MAIRAVEEMGAAHVIFNQRMFDRCALNFTICAGRVEGLLTIGEHKIPLDEITGVYTRLMTDADLPELRQEGENAPRRARARRLHQSLTEWYEVAPARVVNRSGAMGSNMSKPYQAQLITRHGFSVPETLVTNDPEQVLEFRARHRRVIYKSISALRSIVTELADADLERLSALTACPVQFQRYIEGTDVRVHTIGRTLFATAVLGGGIDYRYARRMRGVDPQLQAVDLPPEVAERCLGLAASLGLEMAGIDLRVSPEGEVFCFEVNPSPAYSYYEMNTSQPISMALARHLAAA
jgi:glutathione synthase/RimK-type ligase-like ATP-grasp enzyme